MYEHLKALRESENLTQEEFGGLFGIKKTTYQGYESGKREPDSDFWIAVAEKYNVSIDYLMGFTDDPKRSKYATPSKLDQKYAALDDYGRRLVDLVIDAETERVRVQKAEVETVVVDLGTIRRYLSRPAAGTNGMVEGEDYEDIPRTADMPSGADFCVVVSGDSMEPYIHRGETVYVSETAAIEPLDVGVWVIDGATYIKQYYPLDDGGMMLLSANPDREAANIHIHPDGNQSVQCFGKVLGIKKLPIPVYR
ncbi:MAG: helix-turn-helix domain-containing protein [Acidaminococcaceae bacterium]|nr:helix-turn-helix domain-containing protein [Acidaminococcaceae bacterium]